MPFSMDSIITVEKAEELAQVVELPDWVVQQVADVTYKVFGSAADAFERYIKLNFPHCHQWVSAFTKANEHPFAHRLPLMNPWYVAFAVGMYFALLVAFAITGRVLKRQRYTFLGVVHNYFLHLLSLYMSVGLFLSARAAGYSLWNNAAGDSKREWRVAKLVWCFYVSKIPEWIDTFLMLLRRNYRQVSFLHVYHHVTIYVIWWLACLMAPTGEAYFSAMVNSAVHVVMYGYYFLTTLFPSGRIRNVLNRFKFVITKGQMVQFVGNCLQSAYDLIIVPRELLQYNAKLLQLLFWYMISLLVLFYNFLHQHKSSKRVNDKQNNKREATQRTFNKAQKQSVAPNQFKQAKKDKQAHTPQQNNNENKNNNNKKNTAPAKPAKQTQKAKPLAQAPKFNKYANKQK